MQHPVVVAAAAVDVVVVLVVDVAMVVVVMLDEKVQAKPDPTMMSVKANFSFLRQSQPPLPTTIVLLSSIVHDEPGHAAGQEKEWEDAIAWCQCVLFCCVVWSFVRCCGASNSSGDAGLRTDRYNVAKHETLLSSCLMDGD